MAKVILLVSVFCFSFICLSSGFRHHIGPCPDVTAKQDLDIKKLTGTWVKYMSYGFKIRVKPPKCMQTIFTVEADNEITMVDKVIRSRTQKMKTSYLTPGSNNKFTRRILRDISSESDVTKKSRTFTILDTDYNCWAVTYECKLKTDFPKHSGDRTSQTSDDNSVYKAAKITSYPYQASIEVKGRHLCGATIIGDYWVLTAQSCLRNLTKTKVKLRVGTNRLSTQGTLYDVTKALNYSASLITPIFGPPPPGDADMSMYKVAKQFNYKPSVNWLNIAEQAPNYGDIGYITGWGKAKKRKGSVLGVTKVRVMSVADCENSMEGLVNITRAMRCVTSVENVANNCIAETGGPLLINHQLSGVVAYAPPCKGSSTKPVAVTNVGTYSSFVVTALCDIIPRRW